MKACLAIRRIVRNVVAKSFPTLPPKARKTIVRLCNVVVDPELVGRFSPVTLAEAIIHVQREYPLCAACYHPVIDFAIHQYEYCIAQRSEFGCLSNSIAASQSGVADNTLRCRMGCGHFVPASIQVCDCCTYGLLDNSAKATFLATFAPASHEAHASAILAGARRFSTVVKPIRSLMTPADTHSTPTDREV